MNDRFVSNPAYPLGFYSVNDFVQAVSSELNAPLPDDADAASLLTLYFPLETILQADFS